MTSAVKVALNLNTTNQFEFEKPADNNFEGGIYTPKFLKKIENIVGKGKKKCLFIWADPLALNEFSHIRVTPHLFMSALEIWAEHESVVLWT